ncbi:MAG: tetratricopeptide repeat protein [bacterium]
MAIEPGGLRAAAFLFLSVAISISGCVTPPQLKVLEEEKPSEDLKAGEAAILEGIDPAAEQKNLMAEEHFIKGNDYFTQGQFDKAIEEFNKVLELNPNYRDAQEMLARVARERERLLEAPKEAPASREVKVSSRAMSADEGRELHIVFPTDEEKTEWRAANYDNGAMEFKKAVYVPPFPGAPKGTLGNTVFTFLPKRGGETKATFELVSKINRGLVLERVEYTIGVKAEEKRAASIFTPEEEAQRKRREEILKQSQRVKEGEPTAAELSLLRSIKEAYQRGVYDQAIGELDLLIEKTPSPEVKERANFMKGQVLAAQGKYDDAIQQFRKTLKEFPMGVLTDRVHLEMAHTLLAKKDYSQAILEFNTTMNLYPNSSTLVEAMLGIGNAYRRRGDAERAIHEYQKVVDNFPNTPSAADAQFFIGDIYDHNTRIRNYERALDAYRKVLENYSTSKWADVAQERIKYIKDNFF